MKRRSSFRRAIVLGVVALVSISIIIVATPLILTLYSQATLGAKRELNMLAERGSLQISTTLDSILSGAQDVATSQEVNRGLGSALFLPHLETVLADFTKRYTSSTAIQIYDRDVNLVASQPIQAFGKNIHDLLKVELQKVIASDKPPARIRYFWTTTSQSALFLQDEKSQSAGLILVVTIPGLVNRMAGFVTVAIPYSALQNIASSLATPPTHLNLFEGPNGSGWIIESHDFTMKNPFHAVDLDFTIFAHEDQESRFLPVRKTLNFSVGLSCAILLMAGFGGFFGTRWITRPLKLIRTRLNQFHGDRYEHLQENLRFEEFLTLDAALSQMSDRISDYIKDLTEQERIKGEMARAQMEAELNAMRTQMNPHFLFNSLNSISSMMSIDTDDAAKMIQNLADLYRAILMSSKQTTNDLQAELDIVRNYLKLEQMRFGDRLTYEIKAPENASAIQIPGLVLQTLVENAVKHGISTARSKGYVNISIIAADAGFQVSIFNSRGGAIPSPSKSTGTGSGLEITKKRLDLLYESKHNLSMAHTPEETVVSFWISGS